MILAEEDVKKLLTCTEFFMNHVHWVQQSFNLQPDRGHYGACINYVDLQEYRDEFCDELINTVSEWVYSQKKAAKIIADNIGNGRNSQNAQAAFVQHAFKKFRNRDNRELFIQGQFGELLLFNFLQSFFSAVPLMRKMSITTSPGMERYGVDALHYSRKGTKHLIYLGEGKTYASKYKFAAAFEDAVNSILKTYVDHRKELDLYIWDDFIDDDLINIAHSYKQGTLEEVEVHLVAVIVYNETKRIAKKSEEQIKADIMNIISERGKDLERKIFKVIEPGLHPRLNYIILPVWELDELLRTFQTKLGK
jgi:hypothetical protein